MVVADFDQDLLVNRFLNKLLPINKKLDVKKMNLTQPNLKQEVFGRVFVDDKL